MRRLLAAMWRLLAHHNLWILRRLAESPSALVETRPPQNSRSNDAQEDCDLRKLQGTWKLFRAEHNGKGFAATGSIVFEKNGDYLMIWNGEVEEGTDRLDPAKMPKEIDVVIKTGDRRGSTLTGIYNIVGDIFTACYGREFKVRPTDFSSKNDGYLFVWKRRTGWCSRLARQVMLPFWKPHLRGIEDQLETANPA